MGLLEDLATPAKINRGGRGCSFRAWLATLGAEEQAAVRDQIGKRSDYELASIITANGFTVSVSTIGKHRRGQCVSCRS